MIVCDENAFVAEGKMTIEGVQEHFLCTTCGEEHAYPLFDALLAKTGTGLPCPSCHGEIDIQLDFSFGLHGRVADVFIPDEIASWEQDGEQWQFYPFLVIIESRDKDDPGLQTWLPFWHRAKSPDGLVRTYFGRYALCLQVDPFRELLEQARKKGYFQD
jgi:hypothetical protein